jgi:hypothetical protein
MATSEGVASSQPPCFYSCMPFENISAIAANKDRFVWAYCKNEQGCGHNAKLNLQAILLTHGDMPTDRLRDRLRCSKCGGAVRIVMSWK